MRMMAVMTTKPPRPNIRESRHFLWVESWRRGISWRGSRRIVISRRASMMDMANQKER